MRGTWGYVAQTEASSLAFFPDRVDQTHHALLEQILAVPACQKKGAGTGTHQTAVPGDKDLLRLADAGGGQGAQDFISLRFQGKLHGISRFVHRLFSLSIL